MSASLARSRRVPAPRSFRRPGGAGRILRGWAALLRRDERGQDLVELTVVAPLLLLLLFGIVEFGSIFDSQHTMSYLTREGASIASRGTPLDTVLAVTMRNGADIGLSDRGGAVVSRVTVAGSTAEVEEQVASPGYASASRIGSPGDDIESISALNLEDGASVYVVEVFLNRSNLTPIMGFFSGSIPEVLYDRAVF